MAPETLFNVPPIHGVRERHTSCVFSWRGELESWLRSCYKSLSYLLQRHLLRRSLLVIFGGWEYKTSYLDNRVRGQEANVNGLVGSTVAQ